MALRHRKLVASVLLIVAAGRGLSWAAGASTSIQETPAQRDRRMAWWREARFGMFIHWGLYAIPAGRWKGQKIGGAGEWIMHTAKIPVAEYEPLQKQFHPVKFDARQWVDIARRAGMKYIVITSKHHDGFCLFDSKLTAYDVMGTPFRRDVLKELADACHPAGLRICWYHSIMDWHHPDYLPRRPWDRRPGVPADFDRYVEHLKGQVRELLTSYGKIGVLWFDGEWENTWTHQHGKMLYQYVRSLDPEIIVNNRVDKGRQGMAGLTAAGDFAGDFGTPEQEIPATGLPGVDWESCMTMNDSWGFKLDDHNWKSAETLIRNLIDIASKGGNYLLNVGPTAEGLIPEPSVERLTRIGQWMDKYGESIYGTSASPLGRLAWGRATAKPGKLYLHVFQWPAGPLEVPGLKNRVQRAYLLGDAAQSLAVSATPAGIAVAVPQQAPDPIATVVVLEIEGKPEIGSSKYPVPQGGLRPDSDQEKATRAQRLLLPQYRVQRRTMEPIDATKLPDLPAPFWFIAVFKVLGFTLHMVPMHLWYVGTTVALLLAGKGQSPGTRLSDRLMSQMPVLLALGINFGIVPLLFLQVGYCRAFYPATILMAWFWLAIIALLIPAYYGVYVYAAGIKLPGGPAIWHRASGWIAAGLFLIIGFLFANGMSLTARPDAWPDLWARHQVAGAATGTALNLSDPTLWPRWLMMLGLALETTAAWCVADAFWLARQELEDYRQYVGRLALRLALAGAVATTVFGLWYIAFWSAEVRAAMFAFPLVLLTLATGGVCWLPVGLLAVGQRFGLDRTKAAAVVGAQLSVLILNGISRQVVQNIELSRLFQPGVSAQPVATQWDSLLLFLGAFAIGVTVIGWILVQLVRAGQAPAGPSGP